MKQFDLNIEKILEDWEVYHALRELIANAIDEHTLTNTKEPEIYKKNEYWVIRDYGRGINSKHLTQNESIEKKKSDDVIGKYGIGLKDALATLDRNGVNIVIHSKHNKISIETRNKNGFDISTLHAIIDDSIDQDFQGTMIVISGIKDEDMYKAKDLFLKYSNEKIIDKNKHGYIIEKNQKKANIYIRGVKVAEEENFMYSYNITHLTGVMKKAINRERTHVGRQAYSEAIKKILTKSTDAQVLEKICSYFENVFSKKPDELSWNEVGDHTIKELNKTGNYIFLSKSEAVNKANIIDTLKMEGKKVIIIDDYDLIRISNNSGEGFQNLTNYINETNKSFKFEIVSYKELTSTEKNVFDKINDILNIYGGLPKNVSDILISKTMRMDESGTETLGYYSHTEKVIIIKRSELKKLSSFAGVLIHELIHADYGVEDSTREFEIALTSKIGNFVDKLINQNSKPGLFRKKGK